MNYRTVAKEAMAEFVEKRSRFIGHIKPVVTQEEALEFIAELKTKYWDATHNVYAYSLKEGGIRRFSDDGEPQGTAGMPVLDVLQKEDVTDCVLVVTRYFGGTLLGAGGLVRAYSRAAKLALDTGGIANMALCRVCEFECDYALYERATQLLDLLAGKIMDTQFAESVKISFYIETQKLEDFEVALKELSLGKVLIVRKGELFAKV